MLSSPLRWVPWNRLISSWGTWHAPGGVGASPTIRVSSRALVVTGFDDAGFWSRAAAGAARVSCF
eukprot:5361324-Pyramimonas_sp.AAC.1